eukprot:6213912-Pleurochrysis_carterae.AAC.6
MAKNAPLQQHSCLQLLMEKARAKHSPRAPIRECLTAPGSPYDSVSAKPCAGSQQQLHLLVCDLTRRQDNSIKNHLGRGPPISGLTHAPFRVVGDWVSCRGLRATAPITSHRPSAAARRVRILVVAEDPSVAHARVGGEKDPMLPQPRHGKPCPTPSDQTSVRSVRSVRNSTVKSAPKGDAGWVELLARPLARRQRHRASVRACARSPRQRDLATFRYVVFTSRWLSPSYSEGYNGYGLQPSSIIVRAYTLVLRGRGSGE